MTPIEKAARWHRMCAWVTVFAAVILVVTIVFVIASDSERAYAIADSVAKGVLVVMFGMAMVNVYNWREAAIDLTKKEND